MNTLRLKSSHNRTFLLSIIVIILFNAATFCIPQEGSGIQAGKTGEDSSDKPMITQQHDPIRLDSAGEIATVFKTAGEDYRQGRYEDAAANYLRVYRVGINNHILFYNLGNCYFKLNKIGLAMLMWEKGLKLEPSDPLLKENVEFASKRLYDKFEAEETHFLGAVLGAMAGIFNVNGWAITAIIFFWAFGISLFIVQKTEKSTVRRISGYLAALFIFLFIISTVFMIAGFYTIKYEKEGVLLVQVVQVRSGPGTNNPILFILHEGSKVKIEGEQPNWLHISLPNGYNGWIFARTVGVI
jgi:hypothetical protein